MGWSGREEHWLQFHGELAKNGTAKALFFKADNWTDEQAIPRSQCEIVDLDEDTGRATLRIKEWLCKKNGWEEYA